MLPEAVLFIIVRMSAVLFAWISTYALHSTILLLGAWVLSRTSIATPQLRDVVWKAAVVGGLFTATLQTIDVLPSASRRHDVSTVVERRIWNDAGESRIIALDLNTTAQLYEARLTTASEMIRLVPVIIVLAWALYATWILLRVLAATRRARKQLGPRAEAIDPTLRERFNRVREKLGVKQNVRLTVSPERTSPVALGSSEICLPERLFNQLDAEEQDGVLAHEVAHIARRDPAWLLAVVTIESTLFFQPLNKVARMHIQDEAEYLSDDMAIERVSSGVTMARSLSRVAEWMSAGPERLLAPAFVERRSSLLARVRRLLDESRTTRSLSWSVRSLYALALPLIVLFVAPGFTAGGTRAWGVPAFRWEGNVAPGKSIEIKGLMGDIRAESWSGSTVVVSASRHGRPGVKDVQFAVVESESGVTVCTVYPTPDRIPPNTCAPGLKGRELNTKANDVEVDYIVRVPDGVGFIARSSTGRITTNELAAPIVAASMSGVIDIRTRSYASAISSAGNVKVRMGSASWTDTLFISSNSGNIDVTIPGTSSAEVHASSRLGAVRSEFPLDGKPQSFLQRMKPRGSFGNSASGVIGSGGRSLRLESVAGNISIHRTN